MVDAIACALEGGVDCLVVLWPKGPLHGLFNCMQFGDAYLDVIMTKNDMTCAGYEWSAGSSRLSLSIVYEVRRSACCEKHTNAGRRVKMLILLWGSPRAAHCRVV